MAYYRLYFMGGSNGRIERFVDFDAADDAAALALAAQHRGEEPFELWSGARRIRRFETGTGSAD